MSLQTLRARSLADEAALAPPEEVPAAFFASWLGPRMKYSCGLWNSTSSLATAEEAMLELVCERAGIEDGMRILDVGAGWGSLSLWIAERYPRAFVCSMNRSYVQSRFIQNRSGHLNLLNVTGDARESAPPTTFDRVLAIEIIEHTGNPEAMLAQMRPWLAPGGRVFIQAIAHRERASVHTLPWFEKGVMLSDPLLDAFETGLVARGRWTVDGTHYRRTIEAWRGRLEAHREQAIAEIGSLRRYRRWHGFLTGCEEMFGWDEGRAWRVVHRLYEAGSSEGRASTS